MRKALVTAGSRGIGASIVKCLQESGVEVMDASRSTGHDLSSSVKSLTGLDIPDIIVHNLGGTLGITDPYCSWEEWQRVAWLNLGAAVEINRVCVPEMQRRKWGRVVHISSVASLENQGTVPYCSMKAALNAYVRSFGRYVSADGVCVSCVLPGAVITEGGYWDHPRSQPFVEHRMAIKRLGLPDEIGRFVAFLCSDHASFVVGSAFLVDGGQGRAFQ